MRKFIVKLLGLDVPFSQIKIEIERLREKIHTQRAVRIPDVVLKTEVELINTHLSDLFNGNEVAGFVKIELLLTDVVAVRQNIQDGEVDPDDGSCVVYMKSGEFFIVYTPYQRVVTDWRTALESKSNG